MANGLTKIIFLSAFSVLDTTVLARTIGGGSLAPVSPVSIPRDRTRDVPPRFRREAVDNCRPSVTIAASVARSIPSLRRPDDENADHDSPPVQVVNAMGS